MSPASRRLPFASLALALTAACAGGRLGGGGGDLAACRADVGRFRDQTGHAARHFRARVAQLEAAETHCAGLDGESAIALSALDEKLRAGVEQFEFTAQKREEAVRRGMETVRRQRWIDQEWRDPNLPAMPRLSTDEEEALVYTRPDWARHLEPHGPTHRAFAEAGTLAERVHVLLGYVRHKALFLEVVEAGEPKAIRARGGGERLLAALAALPPGARYGNDDPHFDIPDADRLPDELTQPLADWFRTAYPPEVAPQLDLRGPRPDPWGQIARLMAADGTCSAEEWDWALRAARLRGCAHCLKTLLGVPDHGGEGAREARCAVARTVCDRCGACPPIEAAPERPR